MRVVGRVFGLLFALIVTAALAGAAAARAAKDRIVRHEEPDADEVAVAAIFEPLAFESTARQFRGGTLDCWYGGGVFDLRRATVDPAGATLQVRALFGGAQILVPDDWRVETRVVGIGGAADARPAQERSADAPLLRIAGFALFGGFGVASSLPEGGETWRREQRELKDEAGPEGTSLPIS